jgi:hypothetical protein
MTIKDLLYEFQKELEDVSEIFKYDAKPDSEDMLLYIDDAYVKYMGQLAKAFELNEDAKKALNKYTARLTAEDVTSLSNINHIYPGSRFYRIKDDNFDIIKVVEEHFIVNDKYVDVKPVTHDFFFANIRNKYRKPYNSLIWRLDVNKDGENLIHELVGENLESGTYVLTYIKRYKTLSLQDDSDILLPKENALEVVKMALQAFLQNKGGLAAEKQQPKS